MLQVISVQTAEGKPLGLLANFSMHYFGDQDISADYFGLFSEGLKQRIAPEGELVGMARADAGEFIDFEERWTGAYIFENEWQSFRTRQSRDLELITAEHTYDTPGRYTAAAASHAGALVRATGRPSYHVSPNDVYCSTEALLSGRPGVSCGRRRPPVMRAGMTGL